MALEDSSSSEEEEDDGDFETVLGMIFNDEVRRPRRGSQLQQDLVEHHWQCLSKS